MTLGYRTNPMRVGAPLPEEMPDIDEPDLRAVLEELRRAKVELMYALARRRQAWARMRQIKKERDADAARKGVPPYLDNDVHWKVAVGDVRWWKEEVTAQAGAVLALNSMVSELLGDN